MGKKAVPFTTLKISGADAIRLLNGHRSRYRETRQYPFLIGERVALDTLERTPGFNPEDPATIINTSQKVQIPDWIAERRAEREDDGFSYDEITGEWPDVIPDLGSLEFLRHLRTGKVNSEIYLGLARIEKPWHLPAVLKIGNWNECPEAEVHCAFHRSWQDRFGAEIVGLSADTIECQVTSPPMDRETATALAWEHYWYCPDIVEQGCETIENLAATLLAARYWYFWWD